MHPDEQDTMYHKITRPENYPDDGKLPDEIFNRMTAIEDKLAYYEQMLHDANLVLAGVCIGLFLTIILVR